MLLNNIDKVRNFANETIKFNSDIDMIRGSYRVDGKSALGILAFDLQKPIDVEIHSNNKEEIKRFNEVMMKFV